MRREDPVAPAAETSSRVARLLAAVTAWAAGRPGLTAVVLVGSHARGAARPDSDVDLVLVCDGPGAFPEDDAWVARFGRPVRRETERWGRVTSLRVWYADGLEVEFGLAGPDWGADPSDEGEARVLAGGAVVVFDRDGVLGRRIAAFAVPPKPAP